MKVSVWRYAEVFLKFLYVLSTDSLDRGWKDRFRASIGSVLRQKCDRPICVCVADYSARPIHDALVEIMPGNVYFRYHYKILKSHWNKSLAVNYAFRQFVKEDEFFCHADIDVVFPPDMVQIFIDRYSDRDTCATGTQLYMPAGTAISADYDKAAKGKESAWRSYVGGCWYLSAGLFRAVNGFDEEYVGWGSEDDDFKMKVESRGRYLVDPSITFIHLDHPRTGEEDSHHRDRNRRRLAAKVSGEIPLIEDVEWGVMAP